MRERHAERLRPEIRVELLTPRRAIKCEDRSCQKRYHGENWNLGGCSKAETWSERCGSDLKATTEASVFVAARRTIMICAVKSDMLR
jgi:hypothetical protein